MSSITTGLGRLRLHVFSGLGVFQERLTPADLFKRTTMPGNTGHNLVDSIFSNTASPIGDIEKAWFHLYMGASKYLSHYKSSRGKWVLGLHIYILFKSIIYGYQFAGTRYI